MRGVKPRLHELFPQVVRSKIHAHQAEVVRFRPSGAGNTPPLVRLGGGMIHLIHPMRRNKRGIAKCEGIQPCAEDDVLARARAFRRGQRLFAIRRPAKRRGRNMRMNQTVQDCFLALLRLCRFDAEKVLSGQNAFANGRVFRFAEELWGPIIVKHRRLFVLRMIRPPEGRHQRGHASLILHVCSLLFHDRCIHAGGHQPFPAHPWLKRIELSLPAKAGGRTMVRGAERIRKGLLALISACERDLHHRLLRIRKQRRAAGQPHTQRIVAHGHADSLGKAPVEMIRRIVHRLRKLCQRSAGMPMRIADDRFNQFCRVHAESSLRFLRILSKRRLDILPPACELHAPLREFFPAADFACCPRTMA